MRQKEKHKMVVSLWGTFCREKSISSPSRYTAESEREREERVKEGKNKNEQQKKKPNLAQGQETKNVLVSAWREETDFFHL